MAKKRYTEDMTIEDLAIMMAKAFEETKEDILGQILPRLDTLDQKVDALRDDVNTLFFNGGKLKDRVEKLEIRSFGSIQTA